MFDGLKRYWKELKRGTPGKRFQQQYRKSHESGGDPLRKALFLGGGALVIAAGIFFLPAPGPGWAIIFMGGGLMAQESKTAAKMLDWTELRLRAVVEWALGMWKRASAPARVGIVTLALVLASSALFVAYRLFIAK
jgi:uncharacterized protein (TIGR02611 family)